MTRAQQLAYLDRELGPVPRARPKQRTWVPRDRPGRIAALLEIGCLLVVVAGEHHGQLELDHVAAAALAVAGAVAQTTGKAGTQRIKLERRQLGLFAHPAGVVAVCAWDLDHNRRKSIVILVNRLAGSLTQ